MEEHKTVGFIRDRSGLWLWGLGLRLEVIIRICVFHTEGLSRAWDLASGLFKDFGGSRLGGLSLRGLRCRVSGLKM